MTFEVGGYRVVQLIGGPEPARVWRAEPLTGGSAVVLSLYGRHQRDQLRREFELAGSIRHRHLVAVLGVELGLSEEADQLALVTEFLPGGSLRERLEQGPLTPGQTLTVLAAIGAALEVCHGERIVHGDVNPSTVLFTLDGRPTLAGSGRVQAAREAGVAPRLHAGYLSPEVARAAPPTSADDIFALGALALHCLSGAPAWPAADLRDVVVQSAFGQWPAPPTSAPAPLAALLRRLLDGDPDDRPSAAELLRALPGCGRPEPIDLPAGVDRVAARGPLPPVDDGMSWLDVGTAPSWSLNLDAFDEVVPEAPTPMVSPVGPAGPTSARRPDPLGAARRSRVLRSLVTVAVTALLAAGSIGAGLWWANLDRSLRAEPLPVATADPPVTGSMMSSSRPAATSGVIDWLVILRDLDQRRSLAFSSSDPAVLATVYVTGAPAMSVDAERINGLTAAGYRIDGLAHDISAVRVVDGDAAAAARSVPVVLAVTDSLPVYAIRSSDGSVVGQTTPAASAQRSMTLVKVSGQYLIAAVSAA